MNNKEIKCPECGCLVPKEAYDEELQMCENCIQAYEDRYRQEIRQHELERENFDYDKGDWKY